MNTKQYITSQLDNIKPKLSKKTIRIAFADISSLTEFSFLQFIKDKHYRLELVVCYESDLILTNQILQKNGYFNTKVFVISDKFKQKKSLSKEIHSNLVAICKLLQISHFILSPIAKNSILFYRFATKENYPMLLCSNHFNFSHVRQFSHDYKKLISSSPSKICIMNSYDSHLGFLYIKKVLKEVIINYNVPISYVNIHSNVSETNFFQTGGINLYFFLNELIKLNASVLDTTMRVRKSKILDKQISFLKHFHYKENNISKTMFFYNKKNKIISVFDYCFNIVNKNTKFVENTDIWIHVGSLLKMQIVIKDTSVFDIHIYRNSEFLKGKKEEVVQLSDLCGKNNILLDEMNKDSCDRLLNVFFNSFNKLSLQDNHFVVDLLNNSFVSKYQKKFLIFSDYFISLDFVRKLSFRQENNEEKKLKKQFIKEREGFSVGVIKNQFVFSNKQEVYLCIYNDQEIASMLSYKSYQSKILASCYYYYLKFCVIGKRTEFLFQFCLKHTLI